MKAFLFPLLASLSLTAIADYNGNGYYRVENYKTQRYISVIDTKGEIDLGSTTVDLQSIKLQKNFDVVCSDPATVLHIIPISGSQYQIETQGTGIHQIINRYVTLKSAGTADGQKLYFATGVQNGVEKYIGDPNFFPDDLSWAGTNAKNDYRKWMILPITTEGANFFGVQPTVEAAGKYWATMYGDFPWAPFSDGVKAYKVTAVKGDMACMEPVTGTVSKSTPVIFECNTDKPTSNRLSIGGSGSAQSGNLLKGVYFCSTTVATHLNFVKFDPATMRVLGTCADGSVGFITPPDLEYIPANTAYLPVAPGSPAEIRLVDKDTFTADASTVNDDPTNPNDVYSIQGTLLIRRATQTQIDALPEGFYIIGGKKVKI